MSSEGDIIVCCCLFGMVFIILFPIACVFNSAPHSILSQNKTITAAPNVTTSSPILQALNNSTAIPNLSNSTLEQSKSSEVPNSPILKLKVKQFLFLF